MDRGRINQGILLVLIGTYFLLRNLGWIDDSFLHTLWANWPILLIFAGLYVMLSRSRLWFIPALLSIALFLALVGIGPQLPAQEHTAITSFQYDIPAEADHLTINLDAVGLDFTLQKDDHHAVTGQVAYSRSVPSNESRQDDGHFIVDMRDEPRPKRLMFGNWKPSVWQVTVPDTLPTDIKVKASAGNIILDMRGIDARLVDVSTSAGNIHLMFDGSVSQADVTIETAASNVQLTIPDWIGLRIRSSSALGTSNLKKLGLVRDGDWYVSQDYHLAEKRINVDVSSAVSNLKINR